MSSPDPRDALIARMREALRPFAKLVSDYERGHEVLDHSALVPVQLIRLLNAREAIALADKAAQ